MNKSRTFIDELDNWMVIKHLLTSDNYKNLIEIIGKSENMDVDFIQTKNMAMSGYTFGESSIFKDVLTTHPGIFYVFKNQKLEKVEYYDWKPFIKKKTNLKIIKGELKTLNETVIKIAGNNS